MSHINDNGYKSRKLWFAVLVAALIFGGAIGCGYSEGLRAVYDPCVAGLLAVYGMFAGSNVGAKQVLKSVPSSAS